MLKKARIAAVATILTVVGLGLGTQAAEAVTSGSYGGYGVVYADTVTPGGLRTTGSAQIFMNKGYLFSGSVKAQLYRVNSAGADVLVRTCSHTGLVKETKDTCNTSTFTAAHGKCYYTIATVDGKVYHERSSSVLYRAKKVVKESRFNCF